MRESDIGHVAVASMVQCPVGASLTWKSVGAPTRTRDSLAVGLALDSPDMVAILQRPGAHENHTMDPVRRHSPGQAVQV